LYELVIVEMTGILKSKNDYVLLLDFVTIGPYDGRYAHMDLVYVSPKITCPICTSVDSPTPPAKPNFSSIKWD